MTYRVINCFVMATITFGVLGCSTHPLPQDVSNTSTVHIVRKIRCEAKEGMEAVLEKATSQGDASRRHVERIIEVSTIGFEFDFIMTESNSATVNQLTFERAAATAGDGFKLIVVGGIGPDLGVPEKWSRRNTRTFRVIDKLKDLHKARCGRVEGTRPNLIYPITGSTGMAEVVRTYIELEAIADLAPQMKEIITFSDKLDFTTTFAAGAAVDLEFKTTVGTLRLTKASLTASASRQDIHSVTVSLASDGDPDLVAQKSARMMMVPMAASSRPFQIEQIRDKDVREGLARRGALARNRVLLELQRRRLVDEDRAVAARVLGVSLP